MFSYYKMRFISKKNIGYIFLWITINNRESNCYEPVSSVYDLYGKHDLCRASQ